jgi:predicted acetyltransferase
VSAGDDPSTARSALDRRLDPGDLDAYLRLREASFGYPGRSDELVETLTARMPRILGAFVGGELASSLTLHAYQAYVAGTEVPVGGTAAVQTNPEHRRAGHVARLLRRALDEGRAEGFGWNLLYAFDEPFYGRYGWMSVPTGVPLDLPIERLPSGVAPGRAGGLQRRDAVDDELRSAYAGFAATRTFADSRRRAAWDPWEDLAGTPGARVLRFAGDGAFAVVRLEGDHPVRLDVLDLGWCDAAGRAAAYGAIAAFRGQAERVRLEVPWDDPVAVDRLRAYGRHAKPGLMARIADVALAVAPLRAVADDDAPLDLPPVTLRVVDADAPWNEGTWRLTPGPDGCGWVPAAGGAAATLDVRGLTLLLCGAAAPADLRRLGLVEGDGRALGVVAALSGGRTPFRSEVDRF